MPRNTPPYMVSTVDASKVPFSLIPRYKLICNSNIVVFGMINGMVRYIRFNDSGMLRGGGIISKAEAKQLFIYISMLYRCQLTYIHTRVHLI